MWTSRVRWTFWVVGIALGAFLSYTTRYYLNGDGINYIEMGEALRKGLWSGLVNLTESPGYAFLLGLGQIALNTDRSNELVMLKIVNFVSLLIAMASCDLFMTRVKSQREQSSTEKEKHLPFFLISTLCYSLFLFAALNWVRVRLVAPEMLSFALVLGTVSTILKIKENPSGYVSFAALGILSGLSYLFKSFFFPFSAVFFILAASLTESFRKAIPRLGLAVVVMMLVSAALIIPLSDSVGRFSYGEVGRLNFVIYLASEGELEHPPEQLNQDPEVLFYGKNPFVDCTRPGGWDPAYWKLGLKPVFNFVTQLKVFFSLVWELLWESPFLLIFTAVWLATCVKLGGFRAGKLFPPSPFYIFMAVAISGVGLYCLIHIEMRYLASFLFLGFTALVISVTCKPGAQGPERKMAFASILLSLFILALTFNSVVDQTLRGLTSQGQKLSFKETFAEMNAIKDSLHQNGVPKGSLTAIVGLPMTYWARLAEVKVIAEVADQERFLSSSPEQRRRAVDSLQSVGVKALIAQGSDFGKMAADGWRHIPGTRDFYMLLAAGGQVR